MTQTKQKPQLPKFFLVFRIIAPILFVIGAVLIIVSCTALAEYDDFFGLEPSLGCLFPGVICVFFSIPFTVIAYMPNIQRTMVKTSKYIMESSRDDLEDVASTSMGIGINATSKAMNENRDEFENVVSTSAGIVMGAAADAFREHKDDLKDVADVGAYATHDAVKTTAGAVREGLRDTKFCPECGTEIDRDSKFCPECGHRQ